MGRRRVDGAVAALAFGVAVVVAGTIAGCGADDTSEAAPPTTDAAATTPALADTGIADGGPTGIDETSIDETTISETTIEVGDLVFDARVAGPPEGDLVILLHGFPETSYEWRHQMPALAAAGYRVVAPNQRGYSPGARPPDVADYAVTELAADVVGMADALDAEEFHLVGHDWGAGVAWATAIAAPDRLLSLTAVSVPHPGAYAEAMLDPEGDQSQSSGYIDALQAPGAAAQLTANDAAFLRSTFDRFGEDVVDDYVSVLGSEEAMDAALNYYRATDPRSTGPVPAVTVPTLFVWGADDDFLGSDGAALTEQYVDAPYRFEPLEGVGHWIPEDAADQLTTFLLEHLAEYG